MCDCQDKGVRVRSLLLLLGVAAGLVSAPALAQMAGGRPIDIRNTDLGAHDTFSNPDLHDQLLRYRERERSDKIREQSKDRGPSRPAKPSELLAGATINDNTGVAMAKIETVDPDGVVVSMGTAKVKVPADAFGHNKGGLLLDMTKAQFEQAMAGAK
jgi:hypothetical protein